MRRTFRNHGDSRPSPAAEGLASASLDNGRGKEVSGILRFALNDTEAERRFTFNYVACSISACARAINFSFVNKINPHSSENAAQNITAARGLKCSPMKPTARLPSGAVPMNDNV